jgi:hypothetical protein
MLNNYSVNQDGVIHQNKILNTLQSYDIDYVNTRYNSYGEKGLQMAYYRLGFILGQIQPTPNSILDIGYGNGDFLKVASSIIPNCYGNDISNYPLPENVNFVKDITSHHYDVITFFDVLEHFENIDFVSNLKCDYIVISLPWCYNFSDDWFENWKHRRPDEHLWHFNDTSLKTFFNRMNYDCISISNMEDAIRKDNSALKNNYSNILTGVFKKRN